MRRTSFRLFEMKGDEGLLRSKIIPIPFTSGFTHEESWPFSLLFLCPRSLEKAVGVSS